MKLVLGVFGALCILAPTAAAADVVLTLRARIAPQCQVIAVNGVEGSNQITIRTACNVERFILTVGDQGEPAVEAATGQNASAAATADGTIVVSVENPGFQTVVITLADALGDELPAINIAA